jgi:excisionase family DNA binding protein
MTNPLLTPKEVSNLLHISLSTLYRLKDQGCLPFCKIGNNLRFDLADLEQFLANSRIDLKGTSDVNKKNTKQLVC